MEYGGVMIKITLTLRFVWITDGHQDNVQNLQSHGSYLNTARIELKIESNDKDKKFE